ncbi:MAG: CARDB domain-containing protein [Candidatus Bathyarchaeia archaeon]
MLRKALSVMMLTLLLISMPPLVFAAKFSLGDTVEVINTGASGLVVRDAPAGNAIGKKYDGSRGMVLAGPQSASLGGVVYTWWKVRWGDDALEGWSAEGYPGGVDYLKKVTISPSTKFSIGDFVKVYNTGGSLIVRTDPPALSYKDSEVDGTFGKVEGGPFYGVAAGTPGFYHFWKVNYGSVVGWSAENWLMKATPSDLTVEDIWVDPASFNPGSTVTIYWRIKNIGASAAISDQGLWIKAYFDGALYHQEGIEGLGAGYTYTSQRSYTWPSDTNSHTVRVEVDPSNYIIESNEGNNIRSESFNATAPPQFDFRVGVSPSSGSVQQGGSVSATVTVTLTSGSTQTVTLTASGLPSGAYATFSPSSGYPTFASTFTISTSTTIPTGTFYITIMGSGGGLTRTTTYALTVTPLPAPDFSISASPSSVTIQQGSSGSSTITVTSINGFNQPVQLSVSGAPSGVTATLSPSQVTPPAGGTATSTLTVSVSTTATTGSYTLTVTGTSGALNHNTYVSLEITAVPNQPPNTPTEVSQLRYETVVVTVIPEGGMTPEPRVVFKATVSDPDGDSVRLEIELRQIGEAFTGEPTPETISEFVPSGTEVTITRFGLVNGGYHWQYRTKDSKGAISHWVEFGTSGNLDFTVSFPDIGYAIIVEGQGGWREQWIIDLNVKIAYRALRSLGFDDERILYFSNSLRDADGDGDNDVDMTCTHANFELAIKRWAAMRVGEYSPLILYLSGHGVSQPDTFFLDVKQNEAFTPVQLNDWLQFCPQNTPMLIIIDACYSGCFVTAPETISASKRIIITSTHDDKEGYPYFDFFSREFWRKLAQGKNVKQAFVEGAEDANKLMTRTLWVGVLPPPEPGKFSQPWLDDNGDAVGHSPESLSDDGFFAETMKIGVSGAPLSVDLIFAHLCSPSELRVYDSQGRVTGVINGEVKEEIPNSVYLREYDIGIMIFPTSPYLYELAGTNYAIYGLILNSILEDNVSNFSATDIPTLVNAIHQYSVDWDALSRGEEGVTVQIDSNGDGIFEHAFTSDSELTQTEFMTETGTSAIFFEIVWGEEIFVVSIGSNSTVSQFYFDHAMKEIGFNVTGEVGSIGLCNVTIPKALLYGEPWTVLIDGAPVPATITENATHSFLYFTYTHSTHLIQIIGTWVIAQTYSITITTTVGGTTNPTPGTYTYTANSPVQVTAIPDANYIFDHWELDTINVGSANPYTVLMDNNHTLKAVFTYSPPPPPLSVSISPLSASILVGQSVTFTSTVSGGYTPYTYQWYLNGNPVSEATSPSWTFTPTTSGIYYIHLKVTDDKGNTAQSDAARITVTTVPVGGYSIPIQIPKKTEPIIPYITLTTILTIVFTTIKRKTTKKTKKPQ